MRACLRWVSFVLELQHGSLKFHFSNAEIREIRLAGHKKERQL